jgi:hypothetical protein
MPKAVTPITNAADEASGAGTSPPTVQRPVEETFAIIVDGRRLYQKWVATGFCATVRHMASKPDVIVTAFIGYDLSSIAETLETQSFGREDLSGQRRECELQRAEKLLSTTVVDPSKLQDVFLSRLQLLAESLECTQALMIFICAQGLTSGEGLLGNNLLTKYDIPAFLENLKMGIRLSIPNLACNVR